VSGWQFSHYSAVFPVANGELLLCNSFMGAVTRVLSGSSSIVLRAIDQGIEQDSPGDLVLKMLCEHGYFVKIDLDEVGIATQILERETNRRGFSLIILPHENCNFRCVYCYEKFERGKMSIGVAQGLKRLVDENATTWGSLAVQWFGGEPLLARDVIRDLSDSFIATCKREGVSYNAGITTNGSLLNGDVARMLLDRHVRRFQITLDGPAEAHNARRHLVSGKATYDDVLRNLRSLRDQPDEYVVRLRVNFDPESIELIEPWLAEIAPIFAHDERFAISFHPIGRWGGPNDADLSVCNEDSARTAKTALFETATREGFAGQTFRDFLGSQGSTCYAGKDSSVVVGSDGRLYKCTVAFDDERNHVGWLSSDGRLEVDKERWDLWVKTDDLETGKCSRCWFHASCQSRTCPLVAMDQGEPPCPSTPTEMQERVELSVYGHTLSEKVH
jgi:uncharacterized protein